MQVQQNRTSQPRARQRFESAAYGPWLQPTSFAPIVRKVGGGTGCAMIGLLVLFATAKAGLISNQAPWPNTLGVLLFIATIVGLFASGWCGVMWARTVWDRRNRQYCPDCLSYMSRGAHVCPFCGFRDASSALPRGAPQPAE